MSIPFLGLITLYMLAAAEYPAEISDLCMYGYLRYVFFTRDLGSILTVLEMSPVSTPASVISTAVSLLAFGVFTACLGEAYLIFIIDWTNQSSEMDSRSLRLAKYSTSTMA